MIDNGYFVHTYNIWDPIGHGMKIFIPFKEYPLPEEAAQAFIDFHTRRAKGVFAAEQVEHTENPEFGLFLYLNGKSYGQTFRHMTCKGEKETK